MTHRRGAIWTERLLLGLILASLGATLNLLVIIHRHSAAKPPSPTPETTAPQPPPPDLTTTSTSKIAQSALSSPNTDESPDHAVVQKPPEPAKAFSAPEDPTEKALRALAHATTKEVEAGGQADRRGLALQAACESAIADSQRWKRREMLVRQQIAGLTERAAQLESAATSLDAERDVLAHERDALKAALTKMSRRSGYAVLPYKGLTGTWQRPIVLECTAGGVNLQLQGRTFTGLELSSLIHPRSSPFVRAIARELLHIRTADTPDGAPAVPYLVFLVRPDGIRSYYEARTCLEPLGIAFGYELIEQDLVVEIPNLDDLTTWDGSVPLEMPLEPAPRPKTNVAMISSADKGGSDASPGSPNRPRGDQGSPPGWPEGSTRRGRQDGWGATNSTSSRPEDFVWPGRGRQTADDDAPGSGSAGLPRNGDQVGGNGTGPPARVAGGGRADVEGGATSRGRSIDQPPSSGGTLDVAGSSTRSIGTRGLSGGGSGSSTFPQGDASLPGLARRSLGDGSGPAGTGGLNPLPDLEPAGDGDSPPPLQPRLGLPAQQAFSSGLAAGGQSPGIGTGQASLGMSSPRGTGLSTALPAGVGQSQGLGPDQTGMGTGSPGGTGLTSAAPGGVGQSQGLGPDQTGIGTGSPGAGEGDQSQAARGNQNGVTVSSTGGAGSTAGDPGLGGQMSDGDSPSNGAGRAPLNPSSSSGASEPSTQPMMGPLAPYPSDLQENRGSSGAGGQVSSSSAADQPPGSNLSGEFSPSSSAANPGLGMPWSSSTSASATANSSPGGMAPASTSSASSPAAPGSGFALGQDAGPKPDSSNDLFIPPRPRTSPMGSIDVPFEIVVVCRRYDVLLHPGGYRLTARAMKGQGGGSDGLLAQEIRAIVHRRAVVDPMIRPRPAIKFLVEADGADTFWMARRQLLFSLPDWPMSLHVSGSQEPHLFSKETW